MVGKTILLKIDAMALKTENNVQRLLEGTVTGGVGNIYWQKRHSLLAS